MLWNFKEKPILGKIWFWGKIWIFLKFKEEKKKYLGRPCTLGLVDGVQPNSFFFLGCMNKKFIAYSADIAGVLLEWYVAISIDHHSFHFIFDLA